MIRTERGGGKGACEYVTPFLFLLTLADISSLFFVDVYM